MNFDFGREGGEGGGGVLLGRSVVMVVSSSDDESWKGRERMNEWKFMSIAMHVS